jgi:RNA polymerase sigma-70 factor (ECF subfamily)
VPQSGHNAVDVEEFVRLLMANERRLLAHILVLLPNLSDAEDALQETSIVLWRKFSEFAPGSDFRAWAFRVAENVVRNHWAKQHRCRVKFDERLLAAVAADAEQMREELDLARAAMLDCIKLLPPGDRDLLARRYEIGATIKSVAEAVGRPVEGLYKAMRRIHETLHDCVQNKISTEGIHVRKPE